MGQVGSKRMFQPPATTYRNDNGTLMYIKRRANGQAEAAQERLIWMSNTNGDEIPGVLLTSEWHSPRRYTLIYSHAEQEDLGIAVSEMSEVADYLGCDIFCYEYSGYGLSSGQASEKNSYADIRAAYDYLVKDRDIPSDKIIALGRGLGTGPSVDLASKVDVGGLVLISSFLTLSYNNVFRKASFHRADAFNNVDKIRRVRCQVLVVHGMRDKAVPYNTVVTLYTRAKNKAPPVIVPFAERNNIMGEHRYEVLPFIKRYLDNLCSPLPRSTRRKSDTYAERGGRRGTKNNTKAPSVGSSSGGALSSVGIQSASGVIRRRLRTSVGPCKGLESFSSLEGAIPKDGRAPSIDKVQEKLWRILGMESEDDSTGVRATSEAAAASQKQHQVHREAGQNERTRRMVDQLYEEFDGKMERGFLLQCLRARRFDIAASEKVARNYRRMCRSLCIDPKRALSCFDVETDLRKLIFYAPGVVDMKDHPSLFIFPKNVSPKKTLWAQTLRALLYTLNCMHENEEAQIRGVTVVLDLRACSWSQHHRDFWRRMFKAITVYYPCRISNMYIVDGGRLLPGSLSVGRMVNRHAGRRVASDIKLSALSRYFHRSELPEVLTGTHETNVDQFIDRRRQREERSHAAQPLVPVDHTFRRTRGTRVGADMCRGHTSDLLPVRLSVDTAYKQL